MLIPQKFSLAGQTIQVKLVDDLHENEGCWGESDFDLNLVRLQTPGPDYARDVVEATHFHELTHFILHYMNQPKLNRNEKFVDSFGLFLHQYTASQSGVLLPVTPQ